MSEANRSDRITPQRESCNAVLDGARFPEFVPDTVAWLELERAVSVEQLREQLSLDAATFVTLQEVLLSRADDKAAPLRRRDNLIRRLSARDFAQVENWVNERRKKMHDFGPIGILTQPDKNGIRRCDLTVNGGEQPDLVPESYYWTMYLRYKAHAASDYEGADGRLTRAFLEAQQRHHLPIPLDDIQLVHLIAKRSEGRFVSLENSSEAAGWGAFAAIAAEARNELIRGLALASWEAVLKDADAVKGSTVFTFPTATR